MVLHVGLFEWVDTELLDEVLGGNDAMRRLKTMEALTGFLEPVRGSGPDAWRLHSLIREHCALTQFRDARPRFRDLHRRIAVALARRGETLLAVRHAAESGDLDLAGDIVEEAGGIRLWLRYGLVHFRAAIELLDHSVLQARPRLRFARCAALLFAGRLKQAREAYDAIAAETHDEFERWIDFCVLRGILILYGGGDIGSHEARVAIADFLQIADCERADPLVRVIAEHSLCLACGMNAQFAQGLAWAARARPRVGTSGYGRMMLKIQCGQVAMARGEVAPVHDCYSTAFRVARATSVHEPLWAAIAGALLGELDLERYRLRPSPQPPGIPAGLTSIVVPPQAFLAASAVAVGRALDETGPERALVLLDEILDFLRGAELIPLGKTLAAMRVLLLIDEGSVGDAERLWQGEGLPVDPEACLDLEGPTWRQMEALSTAWLRLSIERERFDEAGAFAQALRSLAAARDLRRTLMRGLVLSVVLGERAGNPAAADAHLAEFLALFVETDYARPAVLERRSCAPALERFVGDAADSPLRQAAQSLLMAMRGADADRILKLTPRQREILQILDGRRDKQIAAELGITAYGVRYHLRSLFSKLGTKTRHEAIRRARELGLISGDD